MQTVAFLGLGRMGAAMAGSIAAAGFPVVVSNRTAATARLRPYIDEHKAWLSGLERSGKLFLGGPLLDDSFRFSGSGLMVLRAGSLREVKELADADPFHANGIRAYRLVAWQVNEGSLRLQASLSSGTLTPHSLRHSWVTHLTEDGVDRRFIQEAVGHRCETSTAIYTHISGD